MKNVFAASVALLAAFSSAMPTSSPMETDASITLSTLESRAVVCSVAAVDRLIFKTTIPVFLKARKAKDPKRCRWDSDGCTSAPDRPAMFNFKPACQRHDFGYRNTKAQRRYTSAMKKRIDDQFKKDLYKYCSGFKGLLAFQGVSIVKRAKTEEAEEEFEYFDANDVDPDIEGQVIPELTDDDEE
ncbi:secretory phospholipase A2 [Verticillium alfalfae VaMs.102]|uniref:Secretory phospholipase A2 n=1 Tax=Verticillium alfalfae (strain VaMs.102 / ATCC MYA-4576 / FGSC 10136) TaxID=526221 RepID=C9SAF8_VERA1|nr:secretory phospholipase A2 [Verticillium alfalfae VaMs.102]EEY16326.1 secretory phospholipase A2 [Verticillium alfalfae VaMs.102]